MKRSREQKQSAAGLKGLVVALMIAAPLVACNSTKTKEGRLPIAFLACTSGRNCEVWARFQERKLCEAFRVRETARCDTSQPGWLHCRLSTSSADAADFFCEER